MPKKLPRRKGDWKKKDQVGLVQYSIIRNGMTHSINHWKKRKARPYTPLVDSKALGGLQYFGQVALSSKATFGEAVDAINRILEK